MNLDDVLRRELTEAADSLQIETPPAEHLLARPIATTTSTSRSWRPIAVSLSAACAVAAVVILAGALESAPTGTTAVVSGSDGTPGAAREGLAGAPTHRGADAAESASEVEPPRLVIDVPGCSEPTADEVAAQEPVDGGLPHGRWYVPATGLDDGGWAYFTNRREEAALSDPELERTTAILPDGTGTLRWMDGGQPVAGLSSKGMTLDELEALGTSIAQDSPEDAGYVALPPLTRQPAVYGASCRLGDTLLGVEVLVGDLTGQVDAIGNADPSHVEYFDGYAVAYFGGDPAGTPPPTREVAPEEWAERVRSTSASGGGAS